jgi:hypothetical protein
MNEKKRERTPADREAAMRIGRVFAKNPWPGFEAAVQEYRQIEAELVAEAGDDEFGILETKRRIAEWIVRCADRDEVPFEQMQEAWNGLLEVGFSDVHAKEGMAWIYADYCLWSGHYDAGLGVIEPVIAEYVAWLQAAVLKPKLRKFYADQLDHLKFRRDGLLAFRTGEAEAQAWYERYEARGPSPEEERKQDLGLELFDAMKPVRAASAERSFAEVERAYRQAETDFVARLQGDDEFFVPQVRRRIISAILEEAHKHRQPFEVCRDLWNETISRGFPHTEDRCDLTWLYADCCLFNQQSDAGLAVVEPLLAELREHLYGDADSECVPEFYERKIARLEKLRDELTALPR